jgi:hypothetical protein
MDARDGALTGSGRTNLNSPVIEALIANTAKSDLHVAMTKAKSSTRLLNVSLANALEHHQANIRAKMSETSIEHFLTKKNVIVNQRKMFGHLGEKNKYIRED